MNPMHREMMTIRGAKSRESKRRPGETLRDLYNHLRILRLPGVGPTVPFSLLHWALLHWPLLALVVAVVSTGLGYLVGSMIEKR
jgi:hypothetical protein